MDGDLLGKCGFCKKGITFVEIENILACDSPGEGYKAFSYLCPWCKSILSVQVNPLALKEDTVTETASRVKRML